MTTVLVVAVVWLLLALVVGLGIAQVIRLRDRQYPGDRE